LALAVIVVPRTGGVWRWIAIAVAVLMPALVAWSRMYRGEHHPLDVTGAAILALGWVAALTYAIKPNADLYQPPSTPTELELAARASSIGQDPQARRVAKAEDPVAVTSEPVADADDPPKHPSRRSVVVANPTKMSHLEARRAEISAALAQAHWPEPTWLETTPEDPGHGQARKAADDGVETVFAVGGDGTVRACASALAGTETALAVMPMGTGNLLAANLHLPKEVGDVVAVATEGDRRHLDLGVMDERCFTVIAGMGLDAEMIHDAPEKLKARLGWPAYAVAAARHLCGRPMRVAISLDHAPPLNRAARTVLICNVGRLQGDMALLPAATPDDGLLDVAVLMPPRRRDWLALAWAMVRRKPTPPTLEAFRAKHVDVETDRQQPRELDGDAIEPSRSLTATIRPAALWLCVPRATGG
jgi:YegS/Rv2252/BmrU family lipid kinase